MDEFTSIFYVPAEAYRFIGLSAIVFIAITSLLIRFLTTRLTEIAEILEHHGLIGGGVYSFSYLVLGPMISFVAISSIMVDSPVRIRYPVFSAPAGARRSHRQGRAITAAGAVGERHTTRKG